MKGAFRDYSRAMHVVTKFLAHTREMVAESIRNGRVRWLFIGVVVVVVLRLFEFLRSFLRSFVPSFLRCSPLMINSQRRQPTNHRHRCKTTSADMIEATCMCKFVGTGFGGDVVNAVRKVMGARGCRRTRTSSLASFLPLATCAAEGDNTIMELKIVQDIVRGRTPFVPVSLAGRVVWDARGRKALAAYCLALARATLLGKRALGAGRLLRDVAWARAHLRVVDVWLSHTKDDPVQRAWLDAADRVLMEVPNALPDVCGERERARRERGVGRGASINE